MYVPSLPSTRPRRRLLGTAMALPLPTVGAVAAPVSATVPAAAPSLGTTVEGRCHPAGAGCHGSDSAESCLSWGARIPSTVAPNSLTIVTIEVDSVPGQWTWSCPSPDGDRAAGIGAFYIDRGKDESVSKLADSGLDFFDHLYCNQHGDGAGSVTAVPCIPEHLSLTCEVDFDPARDQSSYLDLDLGTTVVAPGADVRSYIFSPKITTSTGNLVLMPTATAKKLATSRVHATASTQEATVDGVAKDISRFTMTAWNNSTIPLFSFTISVDRTKGQAQVGTLTCDLISFGGKAVSVIGPAENLIVSNGTTKVLQGEDVTCQVNLTSVVGRNTAKAALTTGRQTFSSDFTKDHPTSEVKIQSTDRGVEAAPTGTYEIEVDYSVTFISTTDANGHTSNIILYPSIPAGFSFMYVLDSGVPWWISMDDYVLQPDGFIPLSASDTLYAHSSTTMTFIAFYRANAAAVTEDTWESLGIRDFKDPFKGLTIQIDVVGNDGVKPGTHSVCAVVMHTKN